MVLMLMFSLGQDDGLDGDAAADLESWGGMLPALPRRRGTTSMEHAGELTPRQIEANRTSNTVNGFLLWFRLVLKLLAKTLHRGCWIRAA